MRGRFLPPALLLAAITACSDQPQPTAESDASAPLATPAAPPSGRMLSASERSDEVRLEALTQRIARALANPGFRAYVKAELDASGYAEHKVHFQRFLRANGGRALKELAEAGNERESDVAADADAAIPLEMYLPVPAHRASWQGGEQVLVATAIADHEAPIAFDVRGHRQVLDPRVPPAVPVIAVVPAETNFNQPPARATCGDCTGGDATPPSGGTITPSVSSVPGLYLTYAGFVQDFEGWLKGDPEFEIHIMGPATATDTTNLASFQCVGEKAPGSYAWDMNALTWTGSQLIFSGAQMDAFNTAFPGRAFVIFALEDDDTSCGIRTDSNRGETLLKALSLAYNDYKGAKDQPVTILNRLQRILRAARTGSRLLSSAYSFLKSNDDIIGIAVSDSVRGRYNSLTNWTALDKDLNSNGVFRLEMQ